MYRKRCPYCNEIMFEVKNPDGPGGYFECDYCGCCIEIDIPTIYDEEEDWFADTYEKS